MFLVKCKCGCEYKFSENFLKTVHPEERKCPACGINHDFGKKHLIVEMYPLSEYQPYEIFRIPDNLKL